MNKFFILWTLLTASLGAYAQTVCEQRNPRGNFATDDLRAESIRACEANGGNQNGSGSNNGNGSNEVASRCDRLYTSAPVGTLATAGATAPNVSYFASGGAPRPAVTTPASPDLALPAIPTSQNDNLKLCRGYEAISGNLGASLGQTENRVSQDGKIRCFRKAGITADWDSCSSAVGLYNTILVAEAAMQVIQGVQQNRAETQAQNQYTTRSAQGDAQNAAYDAQVAQVNSARALNQQQAAAYAAAVAALYSKIQSWIKETPEAFTRVGCGANTPPLPANGNIPTSGPPEVFASSEAVPRPEGNTQACALAARKAHENYQGFVFANRLAKGELTTAAMVFAAKAIAAGIKASQLGDIAKRVTEAKKQTENPFDAPTFERCQINPTDPACAGPITRSSGSGLQEGGFGFGDNFGNNAFTPLGDEEKLGDIAPLPLPGDETVAGVTNPFVDDAKAASGILDPAGAASVQPGAAGGGGGGGGASAPGGGSASLGNDTPGADDSKKENDIKANKADGKYNIAGGGAFQAIKPMKDDNPFANLFDGKGGKLEEDRSIASGDIDGQDSGLFSKISKRYGQIKADGRIEAKNVDE